MSQAACPNCDQVLTFAQTPRMGKKTVCMYCGEDLEIVELNPIILDFDYSGYGYDEVSEGDDDYDWDDEEEDY